MSADVAGVLPSAAPSSGVAEMATLVQEATNAAVQGNKITIDEDSDSELSEVDEDGQRVPPKPKAPTPTPAPVRDADLTPTQVAEDQNKESDEVPQQSVEDKDGDKKELEPIEPTYWDDGVPVFKPGMKEFEPFEEYMNRINKWGMQCGIVKVIPPQEWLDAQPPRDEIIKTIRAPNPIIQEIMSEGSREGHRILNLQANKIYNLPQWYNLCQKPEHQPPARRGERRANADARPRVSTRVKREKKEEPVVDADEDKSTPKMPKKKGRPPKRRKVVENPEERLPTPTSPQTQAQDGVKPEPIEAKISAPVVSAPTSSRRGGRMGGGGGRGGRMGSVGESTSVSSRRKNAERNGPGKINEADFVDFEYKMDISDYTKERCEELERAYWRTLTYAPPLYGADMLGSLFDERTTSWNLGNLPNLLDVMGTKVPGVNTAYLYLGMWKATFAWHLEDVDLYSINYLHFGAPKQWYSISQKDARKFEAAMANIWPQDAKACDQFLRHKTFLISPTTLLNKYGVKVNRTTHYPGEFVITFPYGYHSGFNMGYNCAEAVNFALPSWLEMGRIAKKCDCEQAQDSVWIDVAEIERKMRGEETEYEDSDEEEEEEEDEDGPTDLPTPPESSGDAKLKQPKKKKKKVGRKPAAAVAKNVRTKAKTNEPCVLCPNDYPGEVLLPTENRLKAHRLCAEYTPETYVENGKVYGISSIDKARLDLKCVYCRGRTGAKIQCSQKKCVRSYHATCAAAAGMFVEYGEVTVFGEDGTEYKQDACEFSCRFHRAKRDKNMTHDMLEEKTKVYDGAYDLTPTCWAQFQLLGKEIFAGLVVENRKSEQMLLVEVLPTRDLFEVDYKYLLIPDERDLHMVKPSPNAKPLPRFRNAKKSLKTTDRHADDLPRKDDVFGDGYTWAEFNDFVKMPKNPYQAKVDLSKPKQVLYYLGAISKESTACYSADPKGKVNDLTVAFLNTLPAAPSVQRTQVYSQPGIPRSHNQNQQKYASSRPPPARPASHPTGFNAQHNNKVDKPYVYKPKSNYAMPQHNMYSGGFYGYSTQEQQRRNSQNQMIAANAQTLLGGYYDSGVGPLGAPAKLGPQSYLPFEISTPLLPIQQQTPVNQNYGQMQIRRGSVVNEVVLQLMQKYPYLRKEHNKSPSSYKSPYRQDGLGFCNGYEGDFKAHMAAQMKKDPSLLLKTYSGRPGGLHASPSSATAKPSLGQEMGAKTYTPLSQQYARQYGLGLDAAKPAQYGGWEKKAALHPAIRSDYARTSISTSSSPGNGYGHSNQSSPHPGQQQQMYGSQFGKPQGTHSANWNQSPSGPGFGYGSQQSPRLMTPQASPGMYGSRPASSDGGGKGMGGLAQAQAQAPINSSEQRKQFLQDCTPSVAKSFYASAYSSANANGQASNGNEQTQGQMMGQNAQKGYYMGFDASPQYAPAPSSTSRPNSATQNSASNSRPTSSGNAPVQAEAKVEQRVEDKGREKVEQKEERSGSGVPDLGPNSSGMMSSLFKNLRDLAGRR